MDSAKCSVCSQPEVVEWIDDMAPRDRRITGIVSRWHAADHPMSLDEYFVECIIADSAPMYEDSAAAKDAERITAGWSSPQSGPSEK